MTTALRERDQAAEERRARAYERVALRAEASINRYSARSISSLDAYLRELRRQIVADLAAVPVDDGSWSAYRLRQLRDMIDGVMRDFGRQYPQMVTAATDHAFAAGGDSVTQALRAGGFDLSFAAIDRRALEVARQLVPVYVEDVSSTFRASANRVVTQAVMGALPPYRAIQDVANLLHNESSRRDAKPATLERQAETIIRTEVMGAYNLAARSREAEAAELVPELRKYWRSARDGRVREDHAEADSRYRPGGPVGPIAVDGLFQVGESKGKGPHDPRLPMGQKQRCRCITLLWHPEWEGAQA